MIKLGEIEYKNGCFYEDFEKEFIEFLKTLSQKEWAELYNAVKLGYIVQPVEVLERIIVDNFAIKVLNYTPGEGDLADYPIDRNGNKVYEHGRCYKHRYKVDIHSLLRAMIDEEFLAAQDEKNFAACVKFFKKTFGEKIISPAVKELQYRLNKEIEEVNALNENAEAEIKVKKKEIAKLKALIKDNKEKVTDLKAKLDEGEAE